MVKTDDFLFGLLFIQNEVTDTFIRESYAQNVSVEGGGCSQRAASKQINRKLSGREKCMKNTENAEDCEAKDLHKLWTVVGVKASRATRHSQKSTMWATTLRFLVLTTLKAVWSDSSFKMKVNVFHDCFKSSVMFA